jgi:hypothetical protein
VKKIVSMTLVLMTLVFGLVSCGDGSDGFTRGPFEGTWALGGDSTAMQITFTGNKFEWRDHTREHAGTPNGELVVGGTYEFGSTWIRWTRTWDNGREDYKPPYPYSYTQGYEIKGNVLDLHNAGYEWGGRFVKIK